MPTSLIREPAIIWPAGQVTTLTLTVTLPATHTLAAWASFLLTIRLDPLWSSAHGGRAPEDRASAAWADPIADGWASSLSAAGTVASLTTLTFPLTVPSGAGEKRYALDIWGIGGTPGDVPLYTSRWLTVTPRTR